MVKMGSISKLVPKFELEDAESIAPSVKITIFFNQFGYKIFKNGSKLLKIGSISTLVPKFELKSAESIAPSVIKKILQHTEELIG